MKTYDRLLKMGDALQRVADSERAPVCGILFAACEAYIAASSCECGQIRADDSDSCEDCADQAGEDATAVAGAE